MPNHYQRCNETGMTAVTAGAIPLPPMQAGTTSAPGFPLPQGEGLPVAPLTAIRERSNALVLFGNLLDGKPLARTRSMALRKMRYERERGATQAEIDRLVRAGQGNDPAFNVLLEKHLDLRRRIEALVSTEE